MRPPSVCRGMGSRGRNGGAGSRAFEGAKWWCGLARGPQEIREGETAEHKAARAGRDGGAAEGAQAATERGGE